MATNRYFRPWRFVLPGVVLGIITLVLPIVQGLRYSLHRIRLFRLDDQVFVGLENYRLLLDDPIFYLSIRATIVFTIGTTAGAVVIGLLIASMLNAKGIRGSLRARVLMAVYIVPFVLTPVVVGLLGRMYVWEPEYGLVNYVLGLVGIEGKSWLIDPSTAMMATILTNVWRLSPLAILVFYAALATIPDEILESAEVDGAGGLVTFLRITLPMLRFHIGFVALIMLTSAFREFDTVFSLTGGGPGRATSVLSIMVYNMGVSTANIGLANAISFSMFLIVAAVTIVYIKLARLDEMGL